VDVRIVVALGGNALARRGQPISAAIQRGHLAEAARALAPLLHEHTVTITHGNGPQVGLLLLESEADPTVDAYPLDVLGAESDGMIGYLLQQALLREAPHRSFATLLTQTVVDPGDPSFATPRKPVGPLYDEATARRLAQERNFAVAPDTGGWRRVVPSPEPVALLERTAIRALVEAGVTVIASGGGGVPVILDEQGCPYGVEAVVDKDLAAVLLARLVGAELLLLLTDVDAVYRDFGTPDAAPLRTLDVEQAEALLEHGELGAGSMAPKVRAATRFARFGGTAIVTSLALATEALAGAAGTRIAPADRMTTVGTARHDVTAC
jgi:carbamate kinase